VRADGLSTAWLGMSGNGLHWRRQHTDRKEAAAIGPIPCHVEHGQDQVCTDGRSDGSAATGYAVADGGSNGDRRASGVPHR
jgi:hypothetical protein